MKKYMVCWIDTEDTFAEEEAILRTKDIKPIFFDDKAKAQIVAKALSNKKGINHYVDEVDDYMLNNKYLLVK